jgi:hypothetical protein
LPTAAAAFAYRGFASKDASFLKLNPLDGILLKGGPQGRD